MKNTQQNAELLLNHLSTMPIQINGNDHFVSASIGISFYPHNGTEMESLLKKADRSMYMAKESGRKKIQYFRQQ
jgi:diguanylate cyclase (GGDEF)-like protein